MKIERIELHEIELPLVHPFETSFGREFTRSCILVSAHADGLTGWGECTADAGPWYAYETTGTAWHIMAGFLVPAVLGQTVSTPADVVARFERVRGHPMARAGVENAVWDLLARAEGVSLAEYVGGTMARVAVGVSVGIEPTLDALLDRVAQHVDEGYGRVKLKIKPGWDVDVVRAVRERWPDLPLQVDANCAYTLADVPILLALDQFDLLLVEQPFHHDDIVDHAKLQAQMRTPVCLDESVHSPEHARWALDIDACRVINIKVCRVGGLTAALQIHDLCAERGVPVWCGGMLETNVGRAANVALASLPNFRLPGDISASARYYPEGQDVAVPNFELNADSTLSVPEGPGLGVAVLPERVAAARSRHLVCV
ncbi:MAG TPA: o-succinylbenzoate synthase [Chloroflexi bacterium]|nr:o-succinylbenzoate synthase [Chloroflexota bacterium]